MGEIRLAEAGARRAPLPALVGQRDALHEPLEFAALDTARDDADHAVPAVYRDVVHHLFVAEFIPVTHARRAERAARPERNFGAPVLQGLVDDGGESASRAVLIAYR